MSSTEGDAIAKAVQLGDACPENVLQGLREMSLLQLCKDMQPYFTDEATVAPAMRALARATVGRRTLEEAELLVLVAFFAQKAATPAFCDAAVSSLQNVVEDLSDRRVQLSGVFIAIVDKFLAAVQVQDRGVPIRRGCFAILNMAVSQEALSSPVVATGARLQSIMEAMDGEGDPQCVVLMFDIMFNIMEWAPAAAVKAVSFDMFESLSSYFPVLFTQPPGCPVTKKGLQNGLSRCLSHPALSEFTVPFLLGKIASPSTVVKLDVVHVVEACVVAYNPQVLLDRFALDIVTQLRNEVVKMAAFPDYGESETASPTAATPANVISSSCVVICKIAQLCDAVGGSTDDAAAAQRESKAMQIFEPITEGILQAVSGNAARHTCSAYATMLFNVMVGSQCACLAAGGYVFTMLTVASMDGGDGVYACNANALMVFSALCSGFVDAVDSEDEEQHDFRARLRVKLAKATPAFTDLLRAVETALPATWRDKEASHSPETEAPDQEVLALCQAELLCSALKLDMCLAPWLPDSELDKMTAALVDAAVFRGTSSFQTRVCRLLSGFVANDPENRAQQAVQSILAGKTVEQNAPPNNDNSRASGKSLTPLLALLQALSAASQDFGRFALHEALLPGGDGDGAAATASGLLVDLTPSERNRAIVSILDNFADFDDQAAMVMLDRLLAPPQSPELLGSVRALLVKASDEFRTSLSDRCKSSTDATNSALLTAAVVSCGQERTQGFIPDWTTCASILSTFSDVLSAQSPGCDNQGDRGACEWREVAMNGITGTVVCFHQSCPNEESATTLHQLQGELAGRSDAAFAIALLWGMCLCWCSPAQKMQSSDETEAVDNQTSSAAAVLEGALSQLVKSFVTKSSETAATEELLTALRYFPLILSAQDPSQPRGSLLPFYLAVSTSAATENEEQSTCPSQSPAYWEGLLALLEHEDVRHIRSCESSLLRLLNSVGTDSTALDGMGDKVRGVFFLLDKKGAASFLHHATLANTSLLRVVCGGLLSPSMTTRCSTLAYLSSAAEMAAEELRPKAHMPNPVQRTLFQDARDVILRETLPVLEDKKRLVRQAAGRCRNSWCRVK